MGARSCLMPHKTRQYCNMHFALMHSVLTPKPPHWARVSLGGLFSVMVPACHCKIGCCSNVSLQPLIERQLHCRCRICNRTLTATNGHPKSTLQRTVALWGHARYFDRQNSSTDQGLQTMAESVIKPAPGTSCEFMRLWPTDFRLLA